MSLGARAILLNVFFAVLVAVVGIVSFVSLQNFQGTFNFLVTGVVEADRHLRDIRSEGQLLFSAATELSLLYSLDADDEALTEETEDFEAAVITLNAALDRYLSIPGYSHEDEPELPEEVSAAVSALIADSEQYIENTRETRDASELGELREEFENSEQAFREVIAEASGEEAAELEEIRAETIIGIATTEAIVAAISVVAFIITLLFGSWFGRQLVRPLTLLTRVSESMARGDRKVRADETAPAEHGALAKSFNVMVDTMQQRENDLTELNATLDRRVRERTVDLEAARRVAEENNRLKSEFLATMSHELRTPLNAIEGFTSIVRNRMGGAEYNDKTGRYIDRIEANSKRLLGLINDFLDISRIESGRQQFAAQPFAPEELARKWSEEIGVLADKKGIAFETEIDPSLPNTFIGDEEAISKIALNLLGNAIKFTEAGSVRLALRSQDANWQIAVTDTGIGIPPHAVEFIFDEFRQVDQTSRRKFGGTGLGLAIVQKMARAMGGTVTVDSVVGQGSTFTVTLPQVVAEPLKSAS